MLNLPISHVWLGPVNEPFLCISEVSVKCIISILNDLFIIEYLLGGDGRLWIHVVVLMHNTRGEA